MPAGFFAAIRFTVCRILSSKCLCIKYTYILMSVECTSSKKRQKARQVLHYYNSPNAVWGHTYTIVPFTLGTSNTTKKQTAVKRPPQLLL